MLVQSLEGLSTTTSSSDEGEYDTKDGDSLDEFLQGPSTSMDEKAVRNKLQVKAKVRSLPDLPASTTSASFNFETYNPSHLEGVASFLCLGHERRNWSVALDVAFRSRKSICIETTAYLQAGHLLSLGRDVVGERFCTVTTFRGGRIYCNCLVPAFAEHSKVLHFPLLFISTHSHTFS